MSSKRSSSTDSWETESDDDVDDSETDVMNGTNQPTLQELATKKALSVVLQPSFQDSDFEALEPRLQRLLFSRMRANLVRLQESSSFREKSTPKADAYLHTPNAMRKILAPCKEVYNSEADVEEYDYFEDMREVGEMEGLTEGDFYEQNENPQNGYRRQEHFAIRWRYSDLDDESEESYSYLDEETQNLDLEGRSMAPDQFSWNSSFDTELRGSELIFTDQEPRLAGSRIDRELVHMRGKGVLDDCISS